LHGVSTSSPNSFIAPLSRTDDFNLCAHPSMRPEIGKEVNSMTFSFSDLVAYLNARFSREEGQTMAEYGVVLAVITLGVVLALTALALGITGKIGSVVGYL
jgi:Flp pilus assembly pilin Flp